jgi:hypothetical protein
MTAGHRARLSAHAAHWAGWHRYFIQHEHSGTRISHRTRMVKFERRPHFTRLHGHTAVTVKRKSAVAHHHVGRKANPPSRHPRRHGNGG